MNYFKGLRLKAKLTRREAAVRLGISWFHLRNIETGQRLPSKDIIFSMNTEYGTSLVDLLQHSQKILV